MAQVTNTFSSYDSARNREEFSNAIHMITPEETPFLSLVGRDSIESKHPEWSTDTLATPVATNQKIEGDEFAYSAISPTTRVGNYAEIATKQYLVTRTQEKTLKAGPKSELGRERRKKGVELKQDMEISCLFNKASVAGTDVLARQSGGFPSWITSNDSRDAGGADGGFTAGLTVAATNGTQRAFTKAILDAVILASYNSGGNPTVLLCSPYVKSVFSTIMNPSSNNSTAVVQARVSGTQQATIYAAADTYRSDFGVIDVMPNRQLARHGATSARNAFLIDPDMVAVGIFDDIQEIKPAKTGDADKRVLICEFSLIMKNEAAHGIAADLYGLTAST